MSETPPLPDGAAEVVLGTMRRHRSIRSFTDEALDDSTIERAVAAAQCAATSSWVQAYHLIQVTDAGTRDAIATLAGGQRQVREAGAFFVVCADMRRHERIAERADAPHVASTESFVVEVVDATLFAQNLCLAFEAQGYGTCYIGGIRNDLPRLDALLGLPRGVLPLYGLCVGRPAEDPGVRPRFAPSAVWSKDRYPGDAELDRAIDEHDAEAAAYYAERGAPGRDWSGGTWRKYAKDPRPDVGVYWGSKGARFDSKAPLDRG